MSEIRELEKTLLVDGYEYNINANSAGKVENKLTINVASGATVEFDGSASAELSVMSSRGGEFSGSIQVPTQFGEEIDLDNPKTVLNNTDVQKLVKQLSGYIVFYWNGTTLEPKIGTSVKQNFGIIFGDAGESANNFKQENANKKYLKSFMYIATDSDGFTNILFGDDSGSDLKSIKVEQATAAQTATKATKDQAGNEINKYYQKKITISTAEPSGGAENDIWIKYNA